MNLEQYDEMTQCHRTNLRQQKPTHPMLVALAVTVAVFIIVGSWADHRWNNGRVLDWIDGSKVSAQAEQLKFLPGRAEQPDAVVVLRKIQDTAMLCAQRADSDQMDCRSVGEARKWLRERKSAR